MGSICLVTCNTYFRLVKKTHNGQMINNILVVKRLSEKPFIITSGED